MRDFTKIEILLAVLAVALSAVVWFVTATSHPSCEARGGHEVVVYITTSQHPITMQKCEGAR